MKPLLFFFVILTAVGQEAVAQSLNVMTWNIRYNNPGDGINAWPNRKDWVAEIIIKNNVDIAGLQEVLFEQLEDLKVRLPEMDVSTWNGFKAIVPHHRIDFVFTTKSVRVNRFQTLDDQRESRFPSDHLPVVTELELMKE